MASENDKSESINENQNTINEIANREIVNDEIEPAEVDPKGDADDGNWKRRSKTPTSEGIEPPTTEREADNAYLDQSNADENNNRSQKEKKK